MIKKFIVVLGFILALTFMQNVKSKSNYLVEDDEMIEWHSYEPEEVI
ncbi:hypothetical protein [Schnuerera sp.]|nr:hypothetical protein [Schnuerera sp.]HSH34772.1 hypothetical protein [Schnuerera sp.]